VTAPPPLPPERLYRRVPPDSLGFETTADLPDLEHVLGQERALGALRFGVGMARPGYNLFVLGPPGLGKHALVRRFLEARAAEGPIPPDWCYVNDFEQPHRPRALRLPAGRGGRLRDDMAQVIEDLRSAVPAAFEGEQYRTRVQEIEEELKERQGQAFNDLGQEATRDGIALLHTPTGFAFGPVRDGEVLSPAEFQKLPKEEQERVERVVGELQEKLKRLLNRLPRWQKETRQKLKELNREVARFAVTHLIDELRKAYTELPAVLAYLDDVERDVVDNVDDFRKSEEERPVLLGLGMGSPPSFRRYRVNVLVDNSRSQGAPVVVEENPTYQNLVGRAEHIAQMGTLLTDFTLIKGGALHRASGGFLVLDARKVLAAPYAWEGLKRAVSTREIRIESLGEMLSLISTVSLEPEPIPLDEKVVLVGERLLYYLLQYYDPEFSDLFKVVADFEEEVDASEETRLHYARLISTLCRSEGLRPFARDAVARVLEHSARLAGDTEKLSTHLQRLADLLREADYWAGQAGRDLVTPADVQTALDAQVHRIDRVRDRVYEAIQRGTVLIDTTGARVGQVNGLSVIQVGDFAFAQPSRITATARLGDGKVVDIEREVDLGGPVHSKGVLIITQFVAHRFARNQPLTFAASLAFEQSYGPVEGDSASVAEVSALLSVLSDLPVRQTLAVTGSLNQQGEVQAIGGVNEKVEGFFDVCRARGLTGDQGVVIPAANEKHLMLRSDVVAAAATGRFHVYPVTTVDEALDLLTGVPAGEPDAEGFYPADSVNGRVQARLAELTGLAQAYAQAMHGGATDNDSGE
jgi:lon-related putative ATP-dependent protease